MKHTKCKALAALALAACLALAPAAQARVHVTNETAKQAVQTQAARADRAARNTAAGTTLSNLGGSAKLDGATSGSRLFFDLRDESGVTAIALQDESGADLPDSAFRIVGKLGNKRVSFLFIPEQAGTYTLTVKNGDGATTEFSLLLKD